MKKFLSIILTLVLIFSFAAMIACSKNDDGLNENSDPPVETSDDTMPSNSMDDIDLAETKPCEYVQEKLDAGIEVIVAYCPPTLTDEFMIQIANGLTEDLGELGITVLASAPEYDSVKQIDMIENYVTMGAAAVGIIPMDANSLVDSMNAANESGTLFCFLGTIPEFEVPGACNVNVIDSANACTDMALAWVAKRYPDATQGSVHTAVLGQCNNTDNKKRSEQLKLRAEEEPLLTLGYYTELSNSIDSGYTEAEAAMLADPEIRLFLNFSTSSTVGVSNYIVAHYAGQLDEFGAFTMGNNTSLQELIDVSTENTDSICRGTILQGGDKPWSGLMDVITGLLLDGVEQPYVFYEHMWSYCASDIDFTYDNGVEQ